MIFTAVVHQWHVSLKCRKTVLSRIRYHAAAGHVLLKCHHSFSIFNYSGGSCVVLKFFFAIFLLVDIGIDWYGAKKQVQEKHWTIMLAVFFSFLFPVQSLRNFLCTTLSSSISLVT